MWTLRLAPPPFARLAFAFARCCSRASGALQQLRQLYLLPSYHARRSHTVHLLGCPSLPLVMHAHCVDLSTTLSHPPNANDTFCVVTASHLHLQRASLSPPSPASLPQPSSQIASAPLRISRRPMPDTADPSCRSRARASLPPSLTRLARGLIIGDRYRGTSLPRCWDLPTAGYRASCCRRLANGAGASM